MLATKNLAASLSKSALRFITLYQRTFASALSKPVDLIAHSLGLTAVWRSSRIEWHVVDGIKS